MIIIAALTKDRVIGKDNHLAWHIPEDSKNFKRLTSGNTVIMGKKTFYSIGKPLPNRHNIVLSEVDVKIEGVDVCSSIGDALEKAKSYGKEIFVIGGASIYSQTIGFADKMFLSWIKKDYEGDSFFPEIDFEDWKEVRRKDYDEFEFVEYARN